MLNKAATAVPRDCILCGEGGQARLACAACEAALPRAVAACTRCAQPLPFATVCGRCLRHPPEFDAAIAPLLYAFPVDRLVLRFKGSADFAVGRWLAEVLAERLECEPRPDVLVATPLTRARLRVRGFNQALWAARILGARLHVPLDGEALVKTRESAAQASLGLEDRRRNLGGAFACRRRFDGRHVALMDDVITTGATAASVARALKEAGAERVSVWALARTP